MKIIRPKNTKKKGTIEFFVYQERDKVVGVCLTFNIVEVGNNFEEVRKSVTDAALLHLKAVIKENLSEDLLNRYAPEKYWKKYFDSQKQLSKQKAEKAPKGDSTTTQTKKYTLEDVLSGQIRKEVNSTA